MSKKYRWGILGAGRIAEKFCTALSFVEQSEVYAIASRDADKARAYATKFNAPRMYNNYNDLVKDENVDIIYIATPHAFHYEQTMVSLQNKKAVLCEKPMSLRYRDTKDMVRAANENKVFLMEGMWTASMPFIEKIRSIITDNIIGEPKYVSADFGFQAPEDMGSRLYNKALGGGSMMDIGIYPLFLATLVFGEPSMLKVISKLSATGIDEYANIILQYANGATAHLLSSITFNTAIEAEIIGTRGRIKIKSPWFKATDFSVHLDDGSIQLVTTPHISNGLEHEIREVMRCLDNGLLQSDRMPLHLTVSISKIMEEVLRQADVVYE